MSDRELRADERQALAGDPDAATAVLRQRMRADPDFAPNMYLAAYIGHGPAKTAVGNPRFLDGHVGGEFLTNIEDYPAEAWANGLPNYANAVQLPECEIACSNQRCACTRTPRGRLTLEGWRHTRRCPDCKGTGKITYIPDGRWIMRVAAHAAATATLPTWEESRGMRYRAEGKFGGPDLVSIYNGSTFAAYGSTTWAPRRALDAVEQWLLSPSDPNLTAVRDSQSLPMDTHHIFHVVRGAGWCDGAADASLKLSIELAAEKVPLLAVQEAIRSALLGEPVHLLR